MDSTRRRQLPTRHKLSRHRWRPAAGALAAVLLSSSLLTGVGLPQAQAAGAGEVGRIHLGQTFWVWAPAGDAVSATGIYLEDEGDLKTGQPRPDHAWIKAWAPDGTQKCGANKSYDMEEQVTVTCSDLTSPVEGVWRVSYFTTADGQVISTDEDSINGRDRTVLRPYLNVTRASDGWVHGDTVFTPQLGLFQSLDTGSDSEVASDGSGALPRDVTLWAVSDTGVQYRVRLDQVMGIEWWARADDLGIADAACQPTYKSWDMHQVAGAKLKRADECPDATQYRWFLQKPYSGLPEKVARWADGRAADTWVLPRYRDAALAVTLTPPSPARSYAGTAITITNISQAGKVDLHLDTGLDGRVDAGDPLIKTWPRVKAGKTLTTTWDGKRADGTAIAITEKAQVIATLSAVGEIHFVMDDIEILGGGLQVEQLVGPAAGTPEAFALSWDDGGLSAWESTTFTDICFSTNHRAPGDHLRSCQSSVIPPRTGSRVNTSTAAPGAARHGWNYRHDKANDGLAVGRQMGTYGDQRTIDNWAFLSDLAIALATAAPGTKAMPSLSVTKDDQRTVVTGDDRLTYDVVVGNTGTWDEPGATVKDHLPADVSFLDAPAGDGWPAGAYDEATHTVTWRPVPLDRNQTRTLPLTVAVRPDVPRGDASGPDGQYRFTNYVTVESGDPEVTGEPPANPAAGCSAPLCGSDTDHTVASRLAIAKTNDVGVVEPGQEFGYTITVANEGPRDEPHAVVRDTLPPHVTFVSASDGGSESDGVVSWTDISVAAADTRELTVTVRVDADVPRPVALDNLVSVRPDPGLPEPECTPVEKPSGDSWASADGACAWHRDTTEPANLKVLKEVSRPSAPATGSVAWLVTVGNDGPARARDVVVTDQLPVQVEPESVVWGKPSKGTVVDGEWKVGELTVGETATVQLTGTLSPTSLVAGQALENTVRATSPDDPGKGRPGAPCEDNATLTADTDGCDIVRHHTDTVPPKQAGIDIPTGVPGSGSGVGRALGAGLLGVGGVIATGIGIAVIRRRAV